MLLIYTPRLTNRTGYTLNVLFKLSELDKLNYEARKSAK